MAPRIDKPVEFRTADRVRTDSESPGQVDTQHPRCKLKLLDSRRISVDVVTVRDLLQKNGVAIPGIHVTNLDGIPQALREIDASSIVVKAAVPSKRKAERGMVILCNREDAYNAAEQVFEAMRTHGEDCSAGILIQPQVKPGAEILVSVKGTEYGTITTVKMGGALAEEPTSTVRILTRPGDQLDETQLATQIRSIPGIPSDIGEGLTQIAVGVQRTVEQHPEIGLIEINPVICSTSNITPVDLRVFPRETSPLQHPFMSQDMFDREMTRALDPKLVVVVAPAEERNKGPRYFMTLNALRSETPTRQICFVHPNTRNDMIRVAMPDGGTEERRCFRSLQEVIAEHGIPDLVICALPPEGALQMAGYTATLRCPLLMLGSGFGEVGEDGNGSKEALIAIAREGRNLIIGPNTVGFVGPTKMLATFDLWWGSDGATPPKTGGRINLTTQSGGACMRVYTALDDTPIRSALAIGNAYGTPMGQIARFNGQHDDTVAFYYLESDPGSGFIDAISQQTRSRPVVILKGGRHESNQAAQSHTDAQLGDYEAFKMAAESVGAIVVHDLEVVPVLLQMLDRGIAQRLADKMRSARGLGRAEPGLQIITQSGADGVQVVDLALDMKLRLAQPQHGTVEQIQKVVGGIIAVKPNPVDMGPPGNIEGILSIAETDPNFGLAVVMLNKQFHAAQIPSARGAFQDAVLVITNDPNGSVKAIAKEQGWVWSYNVKTVLEAMKYVYGYSRWLSTRHV